MPKKFPLKNIIKIVISPWLLNKLSLLVLRRELDLIPLLQESVERAQMLYSPLLETLAFDDRTK